MRPTQDEIDLMIQKRDSKLAVVKSAVVSLKTASIQLQYHLNKYGPDALMEEEMRKIKQCCNDLARLADK
jgi:hypothetical protein